MGETYHNQTPRHNVHPHCNGDLHCNPVCKCQQRYLAESQGVGEKAWPTGEYYLYTDGQTVFLGPWVDHAQRNQFRLRQQHQQHQQYQQQQWQQIPPVPIVPQQRPAVCSAPSLGLNQSQTWAQSQQPSWRFVDKPGHVDLTSNYYDIGNHASSNFNNILTSQSTQQPEKLKSDMGHSLDFSVDLTRSPPPENTTATASDRSAKGVGYHNQAPTSPLPETQTQHDASRGFVNVLDPKAYPAPLYHPRPQRGPQRYAARRMINKSDKHLRLVSELMKEEEEEQEYGQENYRYESEDYKEVESGHDNYEGEDYKQEKCPIVPGGTPPFSPPAFTSTANTPQRPEEEELDAILGIYENTWEYKSKPAITAALYKYEQTRLERSKYVLDCLMDMVQVNSDEFKPPTRPDKNSHNNKHNNNNSNNLNDSSSNNNNNNNDNNNHNNKMNDNNNNTTTTATKRKKRDSSSSGDSSFDDEEEDDGCQSESCGNSKRRHLNENTNTGASNKD